MSTWTSFYINTAHTAAVIEKISELTDQLTIIPESDFPSNMNDYLLWDSDAAPSYLAIGSTQATWTSVVHNSADKLEDWGMELSKQFSCKLIITLAQSSGDYYYFALYESGSKIREREVCYSTDFDEIDYGKRFDFEDPDPDEEDPDTFDFKKMEEYCAYFNLALQTDYDRFKWTILRAAHIQLKTAAALAQKPAAQAPKPWWKFW